MAKMALDSKVMSPSMKCRNPKFSRRHCLTLSFRAFSTSVPGIRRHARFTRPFFSQTERASMRHCAVCWVMEPYVVQTISPLGTLICCGWGAVIPHPSIPRPTRLVGAEWSTLTPCVDLHGIASLHDTPHSQDD